MKIRIIIIGVATMLCACKKDRIEYYGSTEYVYFANPSDQTIEYSFAFNPGADRDTVPLVIRLIGNPSAEDRPLELAVDPANTTAHAEDYQLPSSFVLRAGRVSDTIPLILFNSDRLAAQKFQLRLVIRANMHFQQGPTTNQHLDVLYSDIIARPGWWTNIVSNNFLGPYSDTKYRLFIEATGMADMSGLSENEQRAYAIIFRDFLARGREQGETYEDDEIGQINVSPNLT